MLMPAAHEEFEPEFRVRFENKLKGLLSGETHTEVVGWHPDILGNYQRLEITEIVPSSNGFHATARVHLPGKIENLYLRTDSSAKEIMQLSVGFPLPGSPYDPPKEEPVNPPKRPRQMPEQGTGKGLAPDNPTG